MTGYDVAFIAGVLVSEAFHRALVTVITRLVTSGIGKDLVREKLVKGILKEDEE